MRDNKNNNNDNQLKLIYQNIVGLKMILAEMARKYNKWFVWTWFIETI
ncbi:MAG: hypothetical protein WCF23_06765 [Candidatus Nitrosopolaris sp.]